MGIFSVTCKCGNRVSKRARFCNRCGAPTPGGWWKCPGCGKWVGNDVEHCSHCNTRLHPGERVSVAGGVWQKEPSLFAQRIEAGNLAPAGGGSLQVQEGTAAILLEAGEVTHVLEAGLHGIDGLMRKVNWFGAPPPRSVVLVDAGEVIVPLHLENLRTAEHFPLEFYGEAILRFGGDKAAAKAFAGNVLKGARECRFGELAERIAPWIRGAVDELCTTSTLEDLVRDPERRIRLQERMEARLEEELGACGLELVRVSSAEFTGEEYEAWAEKQGEAEAKRREEEYRAALRKMAAKAKEGEWKDEHELREYKGTLDAEWRVSEATREREFGLLKAEWAHDDEMRGRLEEMERLEHEAEKAEFEQVHRHEMEEREVAHGISTGRQMDAYEREKAVEDARASVAAQKLHSEQDVADAEAWVGVKAKKQALALEAKAAEAERRSRMGIEQLLADIEDATAREQLIKLYHLKLQAGMTAQQILATLGQSDHDHDAEYLRKMEELFRENGERADRNFAQVVSPLQVNVSGQMARGESAVTQKSDAEYREDRHAQQEVPGRHEGGAGRRGP